MAGKDVARVVNRCNTAKETKELDLSQCELTQLPDAIFLLLKSTTLTSCDLSENLLKGIPSKLARNFSAITDLKLDCNHLSRLPDEMEHLEQLTYLNISHNHFTSLPAVVYRVKGLKSLIAEGNEIKDVDVEQLKELPNLREINLKSNPLSQESYGQLMALFECQALNVSLTPQDPDFDSVD